MLELTQVLSGHLLIPAALITVAGDHSQGQWYPCGNLRETPYSTASMLKSVSEREGEMTSIQDKIRRELEAKSAAYDLAQAERGRRARDVHRVRRSQQIEGGDISPYAQTLSQHYINGTLTPAEMRAKLLEHYGVTVK